MRCASAFSGIGGMDLGLARAGFEHVFFCESDAGRRRVLERHWPGVPCFEDVGDVGAGPIAVARRDDGRGAVHTEGHGERGAWFNGHRVDEVAAVDLLAGGFPCQDLSVAGRRRGLAGARSGLFFEFARVADALVRPGGWVLIENVPGLLSSNDGRDFAIVLATLAELGFHDLAWRVLDSRYFGVPQRRRRVFVVARRACGGRAQQVLLEPESGGGDFEAGRKAGQGAADGAPGGVTDTLRANGASGGRYDKHPLTVNALDRRRGGADDNEAQAGHLIAGTVRSHVRPGSNDSGGIVVGATSDPDGVRAPSGAAGRVDDPDGVEPLTFDWQASAANDTSWRGKGRQWIEHKPGEVAALQTTKTWALYGEGGVSGDACPFDPKPDGPRYAGCGDAVTANVAEWIGRRIIHNERET